MKNKICWGGILVVTMILSANLTAPGQQIQDLPYREEINKTFRLSKDARVEVDTIAGPVEIETSESDNAEVHIVRAAQTQRELDCYQTVVEQNADSLIIRHEQYTGRDNCGTLRDGQWVKLKLPRTTEVSLRMIAGDVTIGGIENVIRLFSIAGHVRIAQAQAVEINSLAKGLSMSITRLADRGMRITSVMGPIEMNVPNSLNAEVKISSFIGKLFTSVPNAQTIEETNGYRVQIGSNRGRIALSSIRGDVTIRPN